MYGDISSKGRSVLQELSSGDKLFGDEFTLPLLYEKTGYRVDVSLTESFWMLRPLYDLSLGLIITDQCVGIREANSLYNRGSCLAGFVYGPDQVL